MHDLLAKLEAAVQDCIFVPNTCEHPDDVDVFGPSRELEVLPADYRNERDGGRSLAELNSLCDAKEPQLSQHQIDKAEKARRADAYRAQLEAGNEIEYQEDEDRLYRNQLAFVGGMVRSGMLDSELDEIED